MNVLKSFKGKCRNQDYTYQLLESDNELILESYQAGEVIDTLTWDDTPMNRSLVLKACTTIENR